MQSVQLFLARLYAPPPRAGPGLRLMATRRVQGRAVIRTPHDPGTRHGGDRVTLRGGESRHKGFFYGKGNGERI